MAKNGKIRSTSFSKDRQPSNEAKKVKKGKTILKEAIGLQSWEAVQEYLVGKGAEKFITEIQAMEGKEFTINYLQAMEYFKPKLARTEHTGAEGNPLSLLPPALQSATIEQLIQLANGGNKQEP